MGIMASQNSQGSFSSSTAFPGMEVPFTWAFATSLLLARTLATIEAVFLERVVFTPPTSSVFVDERRSAVASEETLVELVERWSAEFTIEEEADFRTDVLSDVEEEKETEVEFDELSRRWVLAV